jgi:predicted Holliday junction resolvase-like endonuclease
MIWLALALLLLSLVFSSSGWYAASKKNQQILTQLQKLTNKFTKISSEFASVRVKHGQTWETFLPLMETFEKTLGPKENAVFLGQPLDLIYFNDDEIVFVEVKTGNSRLSSNQRRIRNLVKDKKIRWEEVNDALEHALPGTDRISSAAMMKTIPHRKPSVVVSDKK